MGASRLAAAAAFVLAMTVGSGVVISSPAHAKQPCTKTMFGNCITGGNRCAKAMHGRQGWDAAGKSWFCKGSRSHPYWERSRCAQLLDQALELERSTRKQGIDSLKDDMAADCPAHYEVFADYVSGKGKAHHLVWGGGPCAEFLQYRINRYAIAFLRQDGYCTGSALASDASPRPSTAISWREAGSHSGTHQRVCGPLAGTGRSTDDVFWNLGLNYPDPGRFTIVLWDVGRVNPPAKGKTLCASGWISLYRGVPQIELRSVGAVQVSD